MIDIGTLGYLSDAWAVNDLGQVVGYSVTTAEEGHAFLWEKTTGMTDLGTLGSDYSAALAINDRGQIVGEAGNATGVLIVHAVLWNTLNPPTPAEQVATLTDLVNRLAAAGTLNQGQANALLAKLEAVTRHLNKGDKKSAANLLQAFINQVRALVNAGIVSAADGQTLIDAAQKLIDELSA